MSSFMVSFDISAIFVCVICLVSAFLRHRTDKLQSKIFIVMLVIVGLDAVSDAIDIMVTPVTQETLMTGILANYTYFIFHAALAPTCFYYMACVAGRMQKYSKKMHFCILIPAIICEILVLLNPLTGWTYTYDPITFEYQRGWVVYILYALGLIYLVLGVGIVCRMWNALTTDRKAGLLFYVGVAVVAILVQMLVSGLRIELFAESIALIGILLTIENEDDRIDIDTGVYVRHILLLDCERYIASDTNFNVICIRFTNIEMIAHMIGEKRYAVLIRQIADWLKTFAPWYHIYKTSLSSFVILNFNANTEEANNWMRSIIRRFQSNWKIDDIEVSVYITIMQAQVPTEFASGEEVLLMADISIPLDIGEQILKGTQLDFLKRRSQVERAIWRGLEEGNFEVYYQPICDINGKICAAEALMRLHDSELGDISPEEFIKLSERNGAIEQIGEFALQEVCRFLASGRPQKAGIELIHVNLSVIQCLNADFINFVCQTVQKYGINPHLIDFEITESVAASDEKSIDKLITSLSQKGFSFSMDDYGTGYSNIHHIFVHDFDLVKVDKTILWDADSSDNGLTVLEYTLKMIHETGYKMVVEGVETQEQVNRLRSLGVDYLQGYYYSKPLPEDAFIEKIKELA